MFLNSQTNFDRFLSITKIEYFDNPTKKLITFLIIYCKLTEKVFTMSLNIRLSHKFAKA